MLENEDVKKYFTEFSQDFKYRKYLTLENKKKLLFLCGANKRPGVVSARRAAIKDFLKSYKTDWEVVFAENVFNSIGNLKSNALDIEHTLTKFSDIILIILESESAFTELGAFSHTQNRNKIIVVNNEEYKKAESFINVGPIKAIYEINNNSILYYKMRNDGVLNTDGIGAIFNSLSKNLDNITINNKISIKKIFLPNELNKYSIFFIHDLIFIFHSLSRKEIINLFEKLLGNNDYSNISICLAVLTGVKFLKVKSIEDENYYSSTRKETFFKLDRGIYFQAATRLFAIKNSRI